MKRLFTISMAAGILISGALHVWEYRKISEFAQTFQTQSELEVKRTALMVIYQQVLRNMARELDAVKQEKTKQEKQNFSELFTTIQEVQP